VQGALETQTGRLLRFLLLGRRALSTHSGWQGLLYEINLKKQASNPRNFSDLYQEYETVEITTDICHCACLRHDTAKAMNTIVIYAGAALAEIAGCFAFWAWLRLGRSVWWLFPGMASLALFALLLTRVDAAFAGRAYAAYGGVYIVSSLIWLWLAEGKVLDRWDMLGAFVCLIGAGIILFGPRPTIH